MSIFRICFLGPESTGKTTLSEDIGYYFTSPVIPEYGRTYTEKYAPTVWSNADFLKIAWGHIGLRHEAEKQSPTLIIEDTDPVATAIWSDQLGVERDPWFEKYNETADLYFLTDIDLPWVDDGIRYWPDKERRQGFKLACINELERRNLKYILLSGPWEDRKAKAISVIAHHLAKT